MQKQILDLDDLLPEEATFQLRATGEKEHVLRPFSLAAQVWLKKKYGPDATRDMFANQEFDKISELIFYLLKDKTDFASVDTLQQNILTLKDRMNVMQALLKTIGISQPIIDKLSKEFDQGKIQSPDPHPIGAQSSTP